MFVKLFEIVCVSSQVHPKLVPSFKPSAQCTLHSAKCTAVHCALWQDLRRLAVHLEAGRGQVQPLLWAPDHVWEVRCQGRVMLFVCVSDNYSITTTLQVITGIITCNYFPQSTDYFTLFFQTCACCPKKVMAFLFVTTIQGYSRVGGNILVKQVKICDEQ